MSRIDIETANCWVETNRSALEWNIEQLKGNVGSDRLFMAVVKGNGYGHGMLEVAEVALGAGADWLGVFSANEGLALRQAGIEAPVLVLGPTPKVQISAAVEAGLRMTVASREAVDAICENGPGGAVVHLKVETGTHRQGLAMEDALTAKRRLEAVGVRVEGAYTHYADIEDTTDHRFARGQAERYQEVLGALNRSGSEVPIAHTACSAATILFPETHHNLVRVGIALYGLWPSRETLVSAKSLGRNALSLRPVMTWKTRIAQIKPVDVDAFVGYGRTFRTTRKSRIAVLPVGYADGYDRALSNSAYVLIRERRAPLCGRVCMNLIMVDVTDIEDAAAGDEVVLLGAQGNEMISPEDLAGHSHTINYEIVTRAAPGAPRVVT